MLGPVEGVEHLIANREELSIKSAFVFSHPVINSTDLGSLRNYIANDYEERYHGS